MARIDRAPAWRTASLLVGLLLAGCSPIAAPPASQPVACGGIPADFGGCSSARPVFLGSTCAEIGAEWGESVDRGVLAVIRGPATVNGQQRSTRVSDVLVLASIVAGMRLDTLGLLATCDTPEFLNAARPRFSADLLDGIGGVLFDGSPVATTEDWERLLVRAIGIIDDGELPSPAPGSPTTEPSG